ncbi:hypothetical protein NHX12_023185 [Muraenolepis orangiensis]|uniref:Peptide-N(4)-(N-acetyl-beta-glucosaminyl)asparagine amidase n=1 Tax=Muraenolepis orangiensis TaxID=630683 RepID=A0A9Q0EKE5_9TELE|nr:hypothetical protein NHX12_023185 [Muraenolepis orangiensis]
MVVSPGALTLFGNPNEVFLAAAELLLNYADNILRFPNEETYRSIRIANSTFSTKLLPVKGAVECLFEMGFEESNYQHVMVYENLALQQKARNQIPHEKLLASAVAKLGQAKASDPANVAMRPSQAAPWAPPLKTPVGEHSEWRTTIAKLAVSIIGFRDHVWTEVYSVCQRRWLHCDSCENTCDKPLMYEVGWGKKLCYIFAFSKDQVVDVTWRYSCKHPEVLTRRTKVQEDWLRETIGSLSVKRQLDVGPERKKELVNRLLVELVEFISPRKPKPGDLGGRDSGSLVWRMARGEIGVGALTAAPQVAEYVFTPTEMEKDCGLFYLQYWAGRDQYCRVSNGDEVLQGWECGVWRKDSLFRKVEEDWQMVYIARTEGSPSGTISWKFDFAAVGAKVKSVSLTAFSQTFNSGAVAWRVRSGQAVTEFRGDGSTQLFPALSGATGLVVEAELCGGEGVSSWQHAQLFRQSLTEPAKPSFEILVHLDT